MVTVLPEIVATLELELVYETVRPEVAVAPRANGAAPYVTAEIAGKVIVCEALLTVRVCVTLVAAA
jgi:hypothetical protein